MKFPVSFSLSQAHLLSFSNCFLTWCRPFKNSTVFKKLQFTFLKLKNANYILFLSFFKFGHSQPLFLYFRLLNSALVQLIVNKIVNDWIRTMDLWLLEATALPTAPQPLSITFSPTTSQKTSFIVVGRWSPSFDLWVIGRHCFWIGCSEFDSCLPNA